MASALCELPVQFQEKTEAACQAARQLKQPDREQPDHANLRGVRALFSYDDPEDAGPILRTAECGLLPAIAVARPAETAVPVGFS